MSYRLYSDRSRRRIDRPKRPLKQNASLEIKNGNDRRQRLRRGSHLYAVYFSRTYKREVNPIFLLEPEENID